LLDFEVWEYRKKKKMVAADISDRKRWREAGIRHGMRKSGLSQTVVSAILNGVPVEASTLRTFAQAMED
jgi:hypothetical protein